MRFYIYSLKNAGQLRSYECGSAASLFSRQRRAHDASIDDIGEDIKLVPPITRLCRSAMSVGTRRGSGVSSAATQTRVWLL
jgi:hypothetical protein